MSTRPGAAPTEGRPDEGGERLDDMGHVGRGAAALVGSQAVSWVFAAVTVTVVPRYLGDVGVGQLAVAVSVWTIAGIVLSFGSESLLTREYAIDVDRGNQLLGRVVPLHIIALGAVAPFMVLYAVVSDFGRVEVALLIIFGITTMTYTLSGSLQAALTGRGRISVGAAIGVVARATGAIAAVLVVVFVDRSVEWIAICTTIGGVIALTLMGVVLARDNELRFRPSRHGYRQVLTASWGMFLLAGFATLYREIDVIVIAAVADGPAVGWYAQTDRLFGTMLIVPASLAAALYPMLSRRWSQDQEETLDIVRRTASTMTILVLPITAGCIALGDELAVMLFGADFAPAGLVLKIYAVVLIPVSFTILLGMSCRVMGRERVWSMVMLAMAVATVPLDLLLVPWAEQHLDNAAAAGAIAFVITETCALWFGARKVVPNIVGRSQAPQLAKAFVAAALMGVTVWLLRSQFIAIPIAVGALLYPTLVLGSGALSLGELSKLGGPFGRLARFDRRSADEMRDAPSPATDPEEGSNER